ncbi:UNVERIFIED_CONTAM: Beta-galactosidase [Trichonephila clavipes]
MLNFILTCVIYFPAYIKYVDRWFNVLLPIIEPFLYNNGGPIITVQIENEYGSIGCDAQYKSHLRKLFKKLLKNNVVLFTTDGSSSSLLSCGKTDEVLSTIDFGSGANVSYNFEMLRWTQASGPLVNSEFYPGWLDHWGEPHANVNASGIVATLTDMLKANASVNVYMFHGGTSFGFTAGSNLGNTFQACPTSYDYDAPLNEAGDPTPKYYAMREAIGKFFPLPAGPVPLPSPKMKLPSVTLKRVMSLWDFISETNNSVFSTYPLSFEKLSQPFGFVLYKAKVTFQAADPVVLTAKGIADRAHVYVNKGIFQNVTLGSQTLVNWTMTPILLDTKTIKKVALWKQKAIKSDSVSVPSIYSGEFTIESGTKILDSFLRVDGWHKGVAFLNNFNLGRYWPIVGPQVTLYTPSILLQKNPAVNHITLLELENAPCHHSSTCIVQFVDTPVVNGTTPL